MNGELSQYSGWIALAYLIVKDVLIPFVNKSIPAKAKAQTEQQKHAQAMEDHAQAMEEKKINSEIATQERLTKSIEELTKNQVAQTELSRVQNERMSIIEADVKDIKQAVVPRRVKKAN